MNQTNKCCEECLDYDNDGGRYCLLNGDGEIGGKPVPLCKCHTPSTDEWRERIRDFWYTLQDKYDFSLNENTRVGLENIVKDALQADRERVVELLYEVDVEKTPTIAEEAWANQFETKAEAFWYGQEQYRKDILQALTKDDEV